LVRAIKVEAEIAVARHFGVDKSAVRKWQRALHVPRKNEGSHLLARWISSALDFAVEGFKELNESLIVPIDMVAPLTQLDGAKGLSEQATLSIQYICGPGARAKTGSR
jgi:hypothetical protein